MIQFFMYSTACEGRAGRRLRFFLATAPASPGCESLTVSVPEGATVSQLREQLFARFPELVPFARSLQFAVDQQYASDATLLAADQEVAIIPPVSGG